MRWWLLPLLALALLAPRQECAVRPLLSYAPPAGTPVPAGVLEAGGTWQLLPPLRPGHPAARLGTDRAGRDNLCLNARGLRRSLLLALGVVLLGLGPGAALGLWLGWRGQAGRLPNEVATIVALSLLLGPQAFRAVLVVGVALLAARLVAVRVTALRREPFIEGALALGAGTPHLLRRQLWPLLRASVPGWGAAALGGVFLWLMELGALGFYDRGVVRVAFTDAYDRAQDIAPFPVGADLGQLVSAGRWAWLDTPEGLVLPGALLALLTLALADLARWAARRWDDGDGEA